MESATVSVIIPAYNQARYLEEAIQSVLDQSYADFEVVVVDDGSTDSTRQVVETFADRRIRYLYQKNKGLAGARNTGICSSRGAYLVFLDADDRLEREALALHMKIMRNHPNTGMSVGGWVIYDSQGIRLPRKVKPPALVNPESLLFGNLFPVHSVLIWRHWLSVAGSFDESLMACEDWDLWLRFAMAGCKIVTFNEIICVYRMHPAQMTRQPKRMRTAMLAVLQKTFNSTNLPEEWRDHRDIAYSAAYVKAAARAYYAGLYNDAKLDLSEAVRLDKDLLDDNASKLALLLAGWADAPMVEDPLGYLQKVYGNLPVNLKPLRKRYRADFSRLSMELGFRFYHRNNLVAARSFILRAILYRPSWLINRGVLSILLRSILSISTILILQGFI